MSKILTLSSIDNIPSEIQGIIDAILSSSEPVKEISSEELINSIVQRIRSGETGCRCGDPHCVINLLFKAVLAGQELASKEKNFPHE
ncbi:hypothetical protein GYA28_02355 [Candidatus Roizmanbacteria bacterium]|jgi:hypothetical protein|nr:hypothetical protein [Candidatus Roizmanbacteria bacterium]